MAQFLAKRTELNCDLSLCLFYFFFLILKKIMKIQIKAAENS